MLYYYQKAGKTVGPVTAAALLALLQTNELESNSPVHPDGVEKWAPLHTWFGDGEEDGDHAEAVEEARAQDQAMRTLAATEKPLGGWRAGPATIWHQARQYAAFLSREFAPERPMGPCCMYRNTPGTERAVFHWEGAFKPMQSRDESSAEMLALLLGPLGHVALAASSKARPQLHFQTAHDFSQSGARAFRQTRRWAPVLEFFGLLTGVLAIFSSLFFLLALLVDQEAADYWGGRGVAVITCGIAAVVLAMAARVGLRWARAARLPPALRTLEKPPFRVRKITWLKR